MPKNALRKIATILNQNNIPYRLGGGMAMHLYGSQRTVTDIDISVSGTYFEKIISLARDHVTTMPTHYTNEKWDCTTLTLTINGQEIDFTDADTLLMSTKDRTSWIRNKTIYEKIPDVIIDVDGVPVSVMNPRTLLEYKRELDGAHQEADVEFLVNILS